MKQAQWTHVRTRRMATQRFYMLVDLATRTELCRYTLLAGVSASDAQAVRVKRNLSAMQASYGYTILEEDGTPSPLP